MQSMDDAEKQAQKRWVTHVWESALLALHRPAAVCLPVMAAVVSLRMGAEFLEALLAHHHQHAVISAWSGESFASRAKALLALQKHQGGGEVVLPPVPGQVTCGVNCVCCA